MASPMSQVGGQSYFEIDVDIHTWGNAALSAFNSIKEGIPKMIMRGGVRMDMCEHIVDAPHQRPHHWCTRASANDSFCFDQVVIEATGDEEMPERMLANVLLSHIDLKQASPFPTELAEFLSDARNYTEPLERTSRIKAATADADPVSADAEHLDSQSASPAPSDAEEDDVCAEDIPDTMR